MAPEMALDVLEPEYEMAWQRWRYSHAFELVLRLLAHKYTVVIKMLLTLHI
jgi:hypothetical protein